MQDIENYQYSTNYSVAFEAFKESRVDSLISLLANVYGMNWKPH